MKTAADRISAVDAGAHVATRLDTANAPEYGPPTAEELLSIRRRTLKNAGNGSTTTSPASAGITPTSAPSEPPSNGSIKRWRKPRDAKGFATQANEVATMILNGEMDLDVARVYSGVARTMAQVLSAEVYRARFLQQAPDLTFEETS